MIRFYLQEEQSLGKMQENDNERKETLVVCRNCTNYFITHDRVKPYGCRAMGFKSRRIPALVVLESSGFQCQLFRCNKKKTTGGGSGGVVA